MSSSFTNRALHITQPMVSYQGGHESTCKAQHFEQTCRYSLLPILVANPHLNFCQLCKLRWGLCWRLPWDTISKSPNRIDNVAGIISYSALTRGKDYRVRKHHSSRWRERPKSWTGRKSSWSYKSTLNSVTCKYLSFTGLSFPELCLIWVSRRTMCFNAYAQTSSLRSLIITVQATKVLKSSILSIVFWIINSELLPTQICHMRWWSDF
jgi:hypothetical protein